VLHKRGKGGREREGRESHLPKAEKEGRRRREKEDSLTHPPKISRKEKEGGEGR